MELKEKTSMVNIQDYLLNESPTKSTKPQPYEVILQNETDFIISHKKAKSEMELVILISEGLFYLRDKKTGNIEPIDIGKIKAFLRGLGNESIALNEVKWLPSLSKDTAKKLETIIFNPAYVEMYRNKVLLDFHALYWGEGLWKQNSQLFTKLFALLSNSQLYHPGITTAFEIAKRFSDDEAVYFAELLAKSGLVSYTPARYRWNSNMDGFFHMFDEEKPFKMDFRSFVEYIFIDAPSQGIVHIDEDFWTKYQSYLTTQIEIYGEIKDRYPRYLKTAHDVMALNARLISNDVELTERPDEVMELAHNGKEYSIIIPNNQRQIAEEGISLNHCVGTNAEKSGNHIIFMRKSKTPEQPLVTLLFSKGRINQAVGQHRRGLNADERKFLENWGNENGIEIAA
jgi:hypothetical protein